MKSKQWVILILVVAGAVFAVTFVSQLIPGRRTGTGPDTPTRLSNSKAKLYFPISGARWDNPGEASEGGKAVEVERAGSYAFWFQNDQPEPVQVGLQEKSCKCTRVEVAILPSAWK